MTTSREHAAAVPKPPTSGARAQSFARNTDLESLLAQINGYLRHAERAQPDPPPPQFPIILLTGAPRSGTTLFMQWLQGTGQIFVPTNLVSRFYAAPAFGLMLQRLLFDARYRYRDEFDLPLPTETEFRSDLGKTRGILGQNGFFFFWREFFPLAESAPLSEAQLSAVDTAGLRRAVWRFAAAAETPLAMKAYLVQYHLRLLEKALDRVLIVHITREPTAVMASLLRVRRTLHGDERRWWGCRPPGVEAFAESDPALQVAAQVALTNRSIRSELASIPPAKQLTVRYEELCDAPAEVWRRLREKLVNHTADTATSDSLLASEYRGPPSFPRSDRVGGERRRLAAALEAVTRSE